MKRHGGPLRILEHASREALGVGNLGVVMARAGVGKSACLAGIGVDYLCRERDVLHVALGQTLDEVEAGYQVQLEECLGAAADAERSTFARHRMIQCYPDAELSADRLESLVSMAQRHLELKPAAILIDGFDWAGPVENTHGELARVLDIAAREGAEVWMTVKTYRSRTGSHPNALPPACRDYEDLIELGLYLETVGDQMTVRLLHERGEDHSDGPSVEIPVAGTAHRTGRYTLLSGGAPGTEACFGECAEEWGMGEIHFSFKGREVARRRGLVELTRFELSQGDVSNAFLTSRMNRTYREDTQFRKVLQSIWHQVSTAGEVFVVGWLLDDGTVRGGTGWAAELARQWRKPVHVFDQEKDAWFSWNGQAWQETETPVIHRSRFAGTGTQHLEDGGRAAIRALFQNTFGDPEVPS